MCGRRSRPHTPAPIELRLYKRPNSELACHVSALKAQVLLHQDDGDATGALFIEYQYFVQTGIHAVSLQQALVFQRQDILFDAAQAFIQHSSAAMPKKNSSSSLTAENHMTASWWPS